MTIQEAIEHAREVAEGCAAGNKECAYQHDKLADWLEELKAVKDIMGPDYDLPRLRELAQADRDGRCVVLPCKPGDTINAFTIGKGMCRCVVSDTVTSVITNRRGWTIKTKSKFLPIHESDGNQIAPISQYPYALADFYVGPHEAAEAALKGDGS